MTLDIHNWSSSAHQEIYKIVKDEISPIVNQVDARVQNFKIQFLKEAAKFVRDFQSLANEADESLAKHKALELEIERLLRAVVSQDIMSIMQNNSVVDTANLQTELERTKERFENCIIKKENEYAKLWNDCDKKCEECKYDKILYAKAYIDMQQTIERLQAQLGDQKGKCKDTPCVSNILDPLPQKLENENVELEFQNKLHDTIYENAKLRAQLFDKVSKQKDTSKVTSNSVPTTNESKVVDNDKVIAPEMFRINPFKNSREEKLVPKKPTKASIRTNPITVSQPHVIIKKVVNSDSNGFSSTGVDITTKTRRPQPRSNTKNDRVPSESKSSRIKNKKVKVEDHFRNLLLSKNKIHMSFECNNIKLAILNDKSKIVYAMCKHCLITANNDACVLNYVNGMNSRRKKQKENVSNIANQTKHKAQIWKPKNVGPKERLASPKPGKSRMRLRWSPTGKMFDIKGKMIASSESNGDNACTPNPQESTIKRFPNSTFFLGRLSKYFMGTVRFGNDHIAAILDLETKTWLWHQRLSHLNFDTINDLAKNDLVTGLPKFKYHKEHLCPSCELGNIKRASHPPKPVPNSKQRLHLLHMDLYGPMRIVLQEYFKSVDISHQASSVRTPQQNRLVERRNHTLVEAARTMLIFSHAPLFLWAEAIATACYTQNRSIFHRRFYKTPYELINARKPDISFLYVFRALCYPKNDREYIRKLGAKGDIGFFIGYSANSCAYRVYNRRTKKIMEAMNVTFDELSVMAFEQSSLKPGLQSMTSGRICSGLDLPYAHCSKSLKNMEWKLVKFNVGTPMEIKDKLDLDTKLGLQSMTNRNYPKANERSTSRRLKGSFVISGELLIWVFGIRRILVLNNRFSDADYAGVKTPSEELNLCLYPFAVPKSFGGGHNGFSNWPTSFTKAFPVDPIKLFGSLAFGIAQFISSETERSYKAVKVRYIRSMIQPEPEGSTQELSSRESRSPRMLSDQFAFWFPNLLPFIHGQFNSGWVALGFDPLARVELLTPIEGITWTLDGDRRSLAISFGEFFWTRANNIFYQFLRNLSVLTSIVKCGPASCRLDLLIEDLHEHCLCGGRLNQHQESKCIALISFQRTWSTFVCPNNPPSFTQNWINIAISVLTYQHSSLQLISSCIVPLEMGLP
ncbi:retrovirus-related pol polyprotein from transposon TNT 1-94 [Tanacetum coccineum]